MGWRDEFERRALAAAGAPASATFDGVEAGSEAWAYSEYTCGTDSFFEVKWTTVDGKKSARRFEDMGELLRMMDEVE